MQRFRLMTHHLGDLTIRDVQARRHIALRRAAIAESDAVEALGSYGFHRNRVAERARGTKPRGRHTGARRQEVAA